jgi:hypothetical protein
VSAATNTVSASPRRSQLDELKQAALSARASGLIRGPGDVVPDQLQGAELVHVPGVQFRVVRVTPQLAGRWLAANTQNRTLRKPTVDAYVRDMRNGDWKLNHQGVAFFADGILMDGQHRLTSIVNAGVTVDLVVSTGWPRDKATVRTKTMDTVDRGANRSIADALGLSHGIQDARYTVATVRTVCMLLMPAGKRNSLCSSASLVKAVCEVIGPGVAYAIKRRARMIGIRSAGVLGATALGYMLDGKATARFTEQLVSGVDLRAGSPVLVIRNWLLDPHRGTNHAREIGMNVLDALRLYMEGRECQVIRFSTKGLEMVEAKLPKEVEAIRALLRVENPSKEVSHE